ncbi:hypothetical protein E0H70_21085 [Rhizobium leguminosarum bv. viciae]|nr:hypothetical protein E0H70_21085 [Rhizobium leguminosarum bv. viciae]
MDDAVWAFEGVKLLGQLLAAGLVGWIGVRWALALYKAEKIWERQFEAYSGVVKALTEMHRVLGEWEDQEIRRLNPPREQIHELQESYRSAERDLDAARGIALLLLPQSVVDLLRDTQVKLYRAQHNAPSFMESIDERYNVIDAARTRLIEIAKEQLKLQAADFG